MGHGANVGERESTVCMRVYSLDPSSLSIVSSAAFIYARSRERESRHKRYREKNKNRMRERERIGKPKLESANNLSHSVEDVSAHHR
jgi:hypothetical protein